jgi:hypothetical protein
MSELALRVTPQDYAPPAMIDRLRSRSAVVGAVAAVIALAIPLVNHRWDLFLRAWLSSYMFWLGLTAGSLVLLMLQYTSGGNWGRLGRRIWEAAAGNMWLMFAFWLPIAFGMKSLYPWARMSQEEAVKELGWSKVHYYLNPTGFWIRALIVFGVWILLWWLLRKWADKEEAGQSTPAQFVRIQNLSGFGIVFYAAGITFLSIDLTMSLDPKWWSTMWGMLFMVGQVLTALCFTIWLLTRLALVEPLSRMFKTDYLHDFGKLMFAFVVLWAYLSFSQWLIIWSGNMLDEIRWYLMRLNGGWQYFGTLLIFVHFVFPFALLLSRNLKRNAGRIVKIAFLVMFMRFVDLFWITAPNFYKGYYGDGLKGFGLTDGIMYVICPIAMGGIWMFFFCLSLSKRSLMPVNDPHFVEMLEAKHG